MMQVLCHFVVRLGRSSDLFGLIRPEACRADHEASGRLPQMRETACPWPGSTGRSRKGNEDLPHDRRDGAGSAHLIQSEAPQVSVIPYLKFDETGHACPISFDFSPTVGGCQTSIRSSRKLVDADLLLLQI